MTQRMPDRSEERGNYSMFMGVFATAVIGFGALGVDISYIAMANNQAQAVADAASHAALVAYRTSESADVADRVTQGEAAAAFYVANNNVGLGEHGDLTTVQFGIFNPSTGNFTAGATPYNAAYAEVERSGGNALDLFLAPIIGQNQADVLQSGVTASNPREIMVVVDRSCSMYNPKWDYQGWRGVHDALIAFSDYMVSHQVPLDQLGVTYFNNNGGTYDALRYVAGNEADILSSWSDWGYCDVYGGDAFSPGTPPSGNDDPGENRFACSGSTGQSQGINPAVSQLLASPNALAFKALIVISDGEPTSESVATFHSACNNAWANDIHVWTVGFGTVNDTTMENATRGVGTYYKAPSAAELPDGLVPP